MIWGFSTCIVSEQWSGRVQGIHCVIQRGNFLPEGLTRPHTAPPTAAAGPMSDAASCNLRFLGHRFEASALSFISLSLESDFTTKCKTFSHLLSHLMHMSAGQVGIMAHGETEGQKD